MDQMIPAWRLGYTVNYT